MTKELCENCQIRPKASGGKNKPRKKKCKTCYKYPNLKEKAKTTHCYFCLKTYLPIQLDIDHIDGVHSNDEYENLRVICSNCHRLKNLFTEEYHNHKYRR